MAGLTRRAVISGLVMAAVVAGGEPGESLADDTSGSGTSCVISGDAYVQKDTIVYSAASGGNEIAKFSGAKAPLKATRFPADASTGRVLVNAGGGFRVEGFTDPRAITMFGSRDLTVVPGHVWISASTPITPVGATSGRLQVELPSGGGLSRSLRAWTSCDALTFDKGTRPVFEMPRNARGYVAKQGSLDLYGEAGGGVIYTLSISGEGSGLLLWGTTVQSGYVHVTSRSSVYIDAWVKFRDVKALPRGELMDQVAPHDTVQNPPQLALKEYQRVMAAPKDINLYFGRGEATPIIGTLEKDAEIYVLETVVGWASVLPKGLHVLPNGDRAFWVKASDLGLADPRPPAPSK